MGSVLHSAKDASNYSRFSYSATTGANVSNPVQFDDDCLVIKTEIIHEHHEEVHTLPAIIRNYMKMVFWFSKYNFRGNFVSDLLAIVFTYIA